MEFDDNSFFGGGAPESPIIDHKSAMQGVVFMPENPQQGSPPPNNVLVTNMEESLDTITHHHPTTTKDPSSTINNQSNRSDSGIFSATANTSIDLQACDSSDTRSDCSSPERKYVCPICDKRLTSQHNFTLHIRSHNNQAAAEDQTNDNKHQGFVCRICRKVLSSSSSLDRHVLVHSGERPFHCKYCGDTFTTNGNMHRHMRTHSNKLGENCEESDGSTGSSTEGGSNKSIEYNNNNNNSKVETNKHFGKRKLMEDVEEGGLPNKRISHPHQQDAIAINHNRHQSFRCPVCERSDFNSIEILEVHLEDNHPEYPAKCNQCNQIFLNNKLLTLHKERLHSPPKQSLVGFSDLTFVDFSSEKFPHIARRECEINMHTSTEGLKFQCHKCTKAFPCSNSLDIHEKTCQESPPGGLMNLSKSDEEIRRAEFFSRLNLQDNSPEKKQQGIAPFTLREPPNNKLREQLAKVMDNTKDLADIQSILSNINMQQLQTKHINELVRPNKPSSASVMVTVDSSPISNSDSITCKNENEQEESQDSFAIEFRKMKLRGEFPCRLCTAVFPNLRALKGHNRAHLSGNSNGTYYCNMCPHSSIDKAALIRHMRTHNGDRPYECALCNYAFTTKANCERHLRNRHSKTTREDVKKSIIYHPSEDPTNDELNKLQTTTTTTTTTNNKEEMSISNNKNKHHAGIFNNDAELSPAEKVRHHHHHHCSTPKVKTDVTFPVPDLQALKPTKIFSNIDFIRTENLKALKENRFLNGGVVPHPFFPQPFNLASKPDESGVVVPPITNKIHVKPFEVLRESNSSFEQSEEDYYEVEEEDEEEEEEEDAIDPPMEEALDLSKKKMDEDRIINKHQRLEEEEPQDLTNKRIASAPEVITNNNRAPNVNELFAQQLLMKSHQHQKIDPAAALYATQLANLYRNGFPTWPGFPVNPLLFQAALPTLSRTPQDLKERMQRLQLCGGSMITDEFKSGGFQPPQYPSHPLPPPLPPLAISPPVSNNNVFNGPEAIVIPKPSAGLIQANNSKSIIINNDEELIDHADERKPLTINVDSNEFASGENIPKSHQLQSPNSVKMVIKNGVLMPKQKQRRYRTERPFTCEHCSARFTLRSNMERHIKQQHPQFWSQRQRGAVGQPGRKPHQGLLLKPSSYCATSYDLPIKIHHQQEFIDDSKEHINEKLRFALLAQQLRANHFGQAEIKKEEDEDCELVIDENDSGTNNNNNKTEESERTQALQLKLKELREKAATISNNIACRNEEDLVPVSRLLDNASQQQFKEYFKREGEEQEVGGVVSEEDEEGLVASGSTSEGNVSGTDENRSESEAVSNTATPVKKKSAYSLAPNRVSCPYCSRKFPWTSSLRRHILTHTGQKPFKCSHCPLLFTTKSNCDRHLLRKHGNSATTIVTSEASNGNGGVNYLIRNVPERPFKCSSCPSSTFSTYSNLKKHISCKHSCNAQGDDIKAQGYEAGGSSEDEKVLNNHQETLMKNDWESQIGYSISSSKFAVGAEVNNAQAPSNNSDLPFKCHLCESSFAERHQALDHIRDKHASEYDLLMSKNALDANAVTPDDAPHHDDDDGGGGDIRGKFPDYSNRKVICAWCMRRFWSAEDLRRHMRTHTGERPFSCDICRRRFTLKHSMLRHRKKHALSSSQQDADVQSDEDAGHAHQEEAPAKASQQKGEESDAQEGASDLISNLLGLRDRSIIDKVLDASADDAAKLLGVKNGGANKE